MKVVSVCSNDWANFAYNFSEALKSVGVDSYSYCLSSHPFGYERQSEVVKIDQLKELTKDADFIVVHHSCSELLPHISDKKVIHYAAGTKYRQNYILLNEDFKDAIATFIALPEFQVYAPKGFHYVVGAIDCDYLQPVYKQDGPIIFGHYPSNPSVKGSDKIINVMNRLPLNFLYSTERVSWNEHIERIKKCDVYIEMLAPEQGGKPYGSFGITALESAALGKIVMTQALNDNGIYKKNYGTPYLQGIIDENQLGEGLILFSLSNTSSTINYLQHQVRDWVEENHSYQATGKRVLNILNGL